MRRMVKIISWPLAIAAVLFFLIGETQGHVTSYFIGIALLGVGILLGILEDRQRRRENTEKPIITEEATVLSRRTTTERVGRRRHVTLYWLTFRTEDGERLEFNVSQLVYEDYDDGETGPLRYRGWEFLSFGVKDKSDFEPMAPLPEEYEPRPAPPSGMQRVKARLCSLLHRAGTRPVRREEAPVEKTSGVLTHELDE